MANSRPSSAFTILEMMISLGLGMLILFSAMAGFRAASQALTVTNRLSLENSVLRAGYFQVEDDLDFWTSLDDPLNPGNQKLRATSGTGPAGNVGGMPFTPLSAVTVASASFAGASNGRFPPSSVIPGSRLTYGEIKARPASQYPAGTAVDPWEADMGFDPTVSWSPSDPRTWCRVNLAEKNLGSAPYGANLPYVLFGRYGIYSNVAAAPGFSSWSIGVNQPLTSQPYNVTTGPAPYSVGYQQVGAMKHTWYGRQIQLFLGALGYEAMLEYLPPNAIYDFYQSYNASTTSYGSMSMQCTKPGWGSNGGFRNGDGNQITACGIYRETYSTSFGYFNPWTPADPNWEPGIFARHYMHFDSDYTAYTGGASTQYGQYGLQDLLYHTGYPQSLMTTKPLSWPSVYTAVGRLVKSGHHVAVAKIRRIDAINGGFSEISFLGLGTTLRGARMQRNPNGGWANWDDVPGASNDPNFDSPTRSTPP